MATIESCPHCGAEILAVVSISNRWLRRGGRWVEAPEPYRKDVTFHCSSGRTLKCELFPEPHQASRIPEPEEFNG